MGKNLFFFFRTRIQEYLSSDTSIDTNVIPKSTFKTPYKPSSAPTEDITTVYSNKVKVAAPVFVPKTANYQGLYSFISLNNLWSQALNRLVMARNIKNSIYINLFLLWECLTTLISYKVGVPVYINSRHLLKI